MRLISRARTRLLIGWCLCSCLSSNWPAEAMHVYVILCGLLWFNTAIFLISLHVYTPCYPVLPLMCIRTLCLCCSVIVLFFFLLLGHVIKCSVKKNVWMWWCQYCGLIGGLAIPLDRTLGTPLVLVVVGGGGGGGGGAAAAAAAAAVVYFSLPMVGD